MEPIPLPEKQWLTLEYLWEYHERTGLAPTFREMQEHFGRRRETLFYHVQALLDKGLIRRDKYAKRGIELLITAEQFAAIKARHEAPVVYDEPEPPPEAPAAKPLASVDAEGFGSQAATQLSAPPDRALAAGDLVLVELRPPRPGEVEVRGVAVGRLLRF